MMKNLQLLFINGLVLVGMLLGYGVVNAEIIQKTNTDIENQINNLNLIATNANKGLSFSKNLLCEEKNTRIEILNNLHYDELLDCKDKGYTNAQGFCTDGQYFYVALVTKDTILHLNQKTRIIKLDINTKEIIAFKDIGYTGHSNTLTYNPKTKSIYIATCSNLMRYLVRLSDDFSADELIFLKDKKGKLYDKIQNIGTLSYDEISDSYIVKQDDFTLASFDSDFKFEKYIKFKNNIRLDKTTTGQAVVAKDKNFFVIFGDLKKRPCVNYIYAYDENSFCIRRYSFDNTLVENNKEVIELEQIAFTNECCYGLANIKGKGNAGFRIYKIYLNNN